MSKKALVVIALKGFQDHELAGTVKGLEAAGFKCTICGKEKSSHCAGKFGAHAETTVAMRDVKVEDYDRMTFIGGPGARALAEEPDAIALAKRFYDAGKIVGAICISPMVLAAAGLLKGKRATVWDSKSGHGPEAQFLKEHGATFVPELPVVVDLPFVTANGPDAADEFGRTLAMV